MKPAAFDYARPATIDEAVALLAAHGPEAKLLAGGQSLMPLLNFRVLRPGVLVDLNRIPELAGIGEAAGGGLRIGAMTRHHAVETSASVRERFPMLAEAMTHVAHLAIRNRGTFGGSLCHADPAAELPMLALLLDGEIRTRAVTGARTHTAGEFFLGPLTTALADDELVTEIMLPPLPPGAGWGFEEVALRHGDFAFVAVAAILAIVDDRIAEARLAVAGVGDTPLRLRPVEASLAGRRISPGRIDAAARQARELVEPNGDLRASADYRRHLIGVLTERTLNAAWRRAA